ncbi:class A beta-lactamase [Spirosoma horti]
MIKHLLLPVALLVSAFINAQPSKQTEAKGTRLYDQLEQIACLAQGRVGVAATLIETGKSMSFHGDEHFPMQSVYKFPIAMATLHQVDEGKFTLDQLVHVTTGDYVSERQHSPLRDKHPGGADVTLKELLRYAVSESDGSASDVLMRLVGGPLSIMTYLKNLGIRQLMVVNTEKEIGTHNAIQYRNWARPDEAVTLLKALQQGRGLTATSRTLLLQLMTDTETGLKRLKGLLPIGTPVAHKTGTSWTLDGITAATNDIGLITFPNGQHMALAVFISDAKADQTTREAVIAKLAKAIWDSWQ